MWIYHLTKKYLRKNKFGGKLHFRVKFYHKRCTRSEGGDFDILFSQEATSRPLFVVECKTSGGWSEVYKFIGHKCITKTSYGIFICGGGLTGKKIEEIDDTYLIKNALESQEFVDLYYSTLDDIFSKDDVSQF